MKEVNGMKRTGFIEVSTSDGIYREMTARSSFGNGHRIGADGHRTESPGPIRQGRHLAFWA